LINASIVVCDLGLKHANSSLASMTNHQRERLILASGSPRRKELLTAVGWPFEAITAGIDESLKPGEDPATYVQRLALLKATAVAAQLDQGLVLGADTTVVVDNHLLGQPVDDVDAKRMLQLLNAKWHEVLTGVAVVRVGGESRVAYETTRVRFAEMSEDEMDWYIATGEARGKAGAYGIQGAAGLFIKEIQGDYFNIVGLPIRLVYELIKD
jgi:septum formation protein